MANVLYCRHADREGGGAGDSGGDDKVAKLSVDELREQVTKQTSIKREGERRRNMMTYTRAA
jgi:hypothetical protein